MKLDLREYAKAIYVNSVPKVKCTRCKKPSFEDELIERVHQCKKIGEWYSYHCPKCYLCLR